MINVLIVDDSAIVRKLLSEKLEVFDDINIIGTATDPYVARDKIVKLDVDVVLLDIEMPRMDGLTFLKFLMKSYPLPVIIVSSLVEGSNNATMKALELGAIDVVPKPGGPFSVGEIIEVLVAKIRSVANINRHKLKDYYNKKENNTVANKNKVDTSLISSIKTTKKIIAIGASTGGTKAFEVLFTQFEKTFPPVLAVIHMPGKFTRTFADRLNEMCKVRVKEAEDKERLVDGCIYIAPGGDYHMKLGMSGAEYFISLKKAPRVNGHRPSVGVLFDSVAELAGQNAFGIILTGMGSDGSAELLNIKKNGGYTIAQDEKSSIVFGMPGEAINLNAQSVIMPLDKITRHLYSNIFKD